jgi:copper chaperone CopZ
LSGHAGVETACVSFEDRETRVRFDSHLTNENRLFAAVRSAGYEVPEGCP